MRTSLVLAALAALAAATPALPAGKARTTPARFTLASADVKPGSNFAERHVYEGFGCSGENVSPQLSWKGAPQGAKSFVVTMYDPDAPTGSGWWHWVVYDVPADVTELPQGAGSGEAGLPEGAKQARTDFGPQAYGGPCPPPGKPHRYVFTVHALKVDRLDVPEDASPAFVGFLTRANAIGSATFTVSHGRKK